MGIHKWKTGGRVDKGCYGVYGAVLHGGWEAPGGLIRWWTTSSPGSKNLATILDDAVVFGLLFSPPTSTTYSRFSNICAITSSSSFPAYHIDSAQALLTAHTRFFKRLREPSLEPRARTRASSSHLRREIQGQVWGTDESFLEGTFSLLLASAQTPIFFCLHQRAPCQGA